MLPIPIWPAWCPFLLKLMARYWEKYRRIPGRICMTLAILRQRAAHVAAPTEHFETPLLSWVIRHGAVGNVPNREHSPMQIIH
jgi:hypothetical protein